jgi:dTDP-4-amino-4,6-dideoxygalactose transaminase
MIKSTSTALSIEEDIHHIDFIDLKAQQRRIRDRIDTAIAKVLDHGQYIMGPEVFELEKRLSEFSKVKHSLSCANGTDALYLILLAKGIGPGDAIFVPAFTFVAPAEAVALVGATPFFVDVNEETYLMDASSLERSIVKARQLGLKPKGVIVVDLFGQPADYPLFEKITRAENLFLLADAAQSYGAERNGKPVGSLTDITTTSFFPAKPLGCYGDGGAIFTKDDHLHQVLLSLRIHGQGSNKYENVRIGINGRLDTIQAAVLIEKLNIFKDEIEARNKIADRYTEELESILQIPVIEPGVKSVWSQYTIRSKKRDRLQSDLKERGIPTVVYYPASLNQQEAYLQYPADPKGLKISERLSKEVLSLPMHAYIHPSTQDFICDSIKSLVK